MSKQSTPGGLGKRASGPDENQMKPKEASKILNDDETISNSSDDKTTIDSGKIFSNCLFCNFVRKFTC